MNVNFISPINSLGYGCVGYNILKTLHKRGHVVSYFPIGKPEWEGDPEAPGLIQNAFKNSELFDSGAPNVRLWHQNEMHMFVGKGKRIGFPIFELDKFNERERHHLSSVDELFVPSKWAKEVVEKNGINVPTRVIPFGVDTNVFFRDEDERAASYFTNDKTIFMNVGKWEKRKGHEELCEAFSRAFTPDEPVELWMMNDNPFIGRKNDEWKRKYIESPMGSNIIFVPRLLSQAEMRKKFNQVDCGVFPSHAEGWGLPILEMMACGAHIIATDYSGHTEYLSSAEATLIKPNGMEDAKDGLWFFGQGQWCTYDVEDLADAMRHVHEAKQSGKLSSINEPGQNLARQYSWDNTVSIMEQWL